MMHYDVLGIVLQNTRTHGIIQAVMSVGHFTYGQFEMRNDMKRMIHILVSLWLFI